MQQHHSVINLDQGSGYAPKAVGAPQTLLGQAHSPIACASLLYLLAGQWAGERVALIGSAATDSDLDYPLVDAARLWEAITTGHWIDRHGWQVREVLTRAGFAQFERQATPVPGPAGGTISEFCYRPHLRTPKPGNSAPIAVCNFTKGQQITPSLLGDGFTLAQAATRGHTGGAGTALTVLLAASCNGGPRGEGDIASDDPLVGSWAGDRIAVVPGATAPRAMRDTTAAVRRMLKEAGEGAYATALNGSVFRPEPVSA